METKIAPERELRSRENQTTLSAEKRAFLNQLAADIEG
jgi:hypothetical protein